MIKYIRIASIFLLICCMGIIFAFSSENAEQSTDTSNGVIAAVVKIFVHDFDSLSDNEKAELVAPFSFFVRKCAHFSIYALLGAFSFLSVFTYTSLPFRLRFVLSSAICLLYSVSDELHQYFVPGRSCELRDVCIDFCGSLTAIGLLILTVKLTKNAFLKQYFLGGDR